MKYARVCILMAMNWPFTGVVGHWFYTGPMLLLLYGNHILLWVDSLSLFF